MQELPIHCIVEGLVDEAAVRKLFSELSLAAGAFYHTSIPAFERVRAWLLVSTAGCRSRAELASRR